MNNEYLKLVKEAQAKRIALTNKELQFIKNLYKDVAADLTIKIRKSSPGSLTDKWLRDYRLQLKRNIKHLNDALGKDLKESILNSANYASAIQMDFFNNLSDKCRINCSTKFSNMFSNIPLDAASEIINGQFYKDGKGLSKRLWNHNLKTNNDVDYIISKGIIGKKNAYDIAKDLEEYINPKARKEWSFKRNSGTSRRVEYNSFRLAVTSISHAYQLSLQRSCKVNPFVEGIKWHTSNSHRGPCALCESREGKIYKSDELPLDHPMGVCYFTPVITRSMEDIGNELNRWINGESNPKLDSIYNKKENEDENKSPKKDETLKKEQIWHELGWKDKEFSKKDAKKHLKDKYNIKFSDSKKYPMNEKILSSCVNWLDKFSSYFENFNSINPVEFKDFKVKAGIKPVGYYRYYINLPKAEELVLNGQFFTDIDLNRQYLKQTIESKWTVANAKEHKTFVHEYGHHVANSLEWLESKDGKVDRKWCKEFIKNVMNEYGEKYGKIDYNDIPNLLGRYAASSPEETFAEAFAEYFGGENPRNFAKVFGEMVEKKMKEVAQNGVKGT
ncbi:hypothetical protein [Clostridium botulinum]|uniref:hypothetical protein n=1 Tax=Clostridium botulinum TaxID=1491 RepID=UPI0004D5EC5E|nr:hypothetical protein [Clostridium botulinum]KEH90476.1 putative exonuclease SbcC [Clostridium botulinum C/D str. It1]